MTRAEASKFSICAFAKTLCNAGRNAHVTQKNCTKPRHRFEKGTARSSVGPSSVLQPENTQKRSHSGACPRAIHFEVTNQPFSVLQFQGSEFPGPSPVSDEVYQWAHCCDQLGAVGILTCGRVLRSCRDSLGLRPTDPQCISFYSIFLVSGVPC